MAGKLVDCLSIKSLVCVACMHHKWTALRHARLTSTLYGHTGKPEMTEFCPTSLQATCGSNASSAELLALLYLFLRTICEGHRRQELATYSPSMLACSGASFSDVVGNFALETFQRNPTLAALCATCESCQIIRSNLTFQRVISMPDICSTFQASNCNPVCCRALLPRKKCVFQTTLTKAGLKISPCFTPCWIEKCSPL